MDERRESGREGMKGKGRLTRKLQLLPQCPNELLVVKHEVEDLLWRSWESFTNSKTKLENELSRLEAKRKERGVGRGAHLTSKHFSGKAFVSALVAS